MLYTHKVDIDRLCTHKVDIDRLYTHKSDIDRLYTHKADIDRLYTHKVDIDKLYTHKVDIDRLYTHKVDIDKLYTHKVDIDSLYTHKVDIDSLYTHKVDIDRPIARITLANLIERLFYQDLYHSKGNWKSHAKWFCVCFIFISIDYLRIINWKADSNLQDFELRANLFHDVKVDKNFYLHSVYIVLL